MINIRRRTVLAALAGAVAAPAGVGLDALLPAAAEAADQYLSNTDLYTTSPFVEGADYSRRFRRHGAFDDSPAGQVPLPDTTVLAIHGGGIEPGTSELCLAIAGYHPGTLAVATAGAALYDYWMFEGTRPNGQNTVLHVTATHCDDPVARSLCAGARRVVSIHGCTGGALHLTTDDGAVLVGGRDIALRDRLAARYAAEGFHVVSAADVPELNGDDPDNIANRTLTGAGIQLELSTKLRDAMFDEDFNTRKDRGNHTTPLFRQFVDATRAILTA